MIAKMDRATRLKYLHQRMIDEISDYAIILLDVDGTILSWNKGAEELKGYKAEEIIGKNFSVFYPADERMRKIPEKVLQQAKKEGRARYIGKRVRKDGSTFWGNMLLTAIHDEDDEVIGYTKLTRQMKDSI